MAATLPKYPLSWSTAHAHVWLDPMAPLALKHRVILPIIGDGPRQMKAGQTYRCRECGDEFEVPMRFARARAWEA